MNAMNQGRSRIPETADGGKDLVTPTHEIEIQWAGTRDPEMPEDGQLVTWVDGTLAWLKEPAAEVAVRMMDEQEISDLNARYRNKPMPTNVLSFPAEVVAAPGRQLLGDIAICTDVIRREADDQGKTLAAHMAHMLVHGVLHLCGYDHIEELEAEEMEQVEREILASFGFTDPYASQERRGVTPHE